MEQEVHLLFKGIELEEPSRPVDEEILAFARTRLHVRTRDSRLRRAVLAHACLGAALVMALFLLLGEKGTSSPKESIKTALEPQEALLEIDHMRTELDQIGEMAELIPIGQGEVRKTLEEKIRLCLMDLNDLEKSELLD